MKNTFRSLIDRKIYNYCPRVTEVVNSEVQYDSEDNIIYKNISIDNFLDSIPLIKINYNNTVKVEDDGN